MSEEKRRDSAGRVASALALPEWSLRRKLALALTIPMLLAATFGGLRVHTKLAESDNYSATAKQVTVLGLPSTTSLLPRARSSPPVQARRSTTLAGSRRSRGGQAGARLEDAGKTADLTATQQENLDSVMTLASSCATATPTSASARRSRRSASCNAA